MGRLFTYMVKAAAGQQPAPYTGSYGTWDGLYDMGAWETAGQRIRLGGGSSPSYRKYLSDRRRHIDNMYNASRSDNVQDWGKLQGAGDYLTALDYGFRDAASIYDILSGNEQYREAIRHLANTGDWTKLKALSRTGRPRGMRSPFAGDRDRSDYLLADGVGNAQLIMNMYLAEEARRNRAAAQQQNAESTNGQSAPQSEGQSGAAAATSAETPTTPATPQPSPEELARASEAFLRSSGSAAGSVARMIADNVVPERALRNSMQQNIAAGRSMYDGVTASTPGMTAGQKLALTTRGFVGNQQQQAAAQAAAEARTNAIGQPLPQSEYDAHTGAGLRMVGHSADGRTRTYTGKSGRSRITVGDNAHAGHYRGVGTADTNTRSNYVDLRQSNTSRAVQSPLARTPYTTRRR